LCRSSRTETYEATLDARRGGSDGGIPDDRRIQCRRRRVKGRWQPTEEELGERSTSLKASKSSRLARVAEGKVEGRSEEELERTWWLDVKRKGSAESEKTKRWRGQSTSNASTSPLPSLAHSQFNFQDWVLVRNPHVPLEFEFEERGRTRWGSRAGG